MRQEAAGKWGAATYFPWSGRERGCEQQGVRAYDLGSDKEPVVVRRSSEPLQQGADARDLVR
jgi:hypothetical protein